MNRIAQLKEQRKPVHSLLPNYLKWLALSLNKMRSVAVYYKEYSTLENLQLLGEEYIWQMKRDLTPKTFQVSILCQKDRHLARWLLSVNAGEPQI